MVAARQKRLRARLTELPRERRLAMGRLVCAAIEDAHKAKPRSRVEFARSAIVIPEGRHEGSAWLPEFQPFAYHLLRLMDTSGYRRFAVTGCVQSGKTLIACVVNVLWHLFEHKQNVIFVVPELTMADQKWEDEIKPAIDASPALRKLAYGDARRSNVPQGRGSKGGTVKIIRFANGRRLQFMGTTGNEARRAGATAQVVFKTEVDRYDTAGDSAREASAAKTVEDRTESFDDQAYIYEECTMTTVNGRINKEVRGGTDHAVHYQCPHCRHYVRPLREHFVGIEGCRDIEEAEASGTFICPRESCAAVISQQERKAMLLASIQANSVVGAGQTITAGTDGAALIEGDLKPTKVLSFWWNAFDNRFWKTKSLAAKEWRALYSDDPDDEDKQAKQKRWAEPVAATSFDVSKLTKATLISRSVDLYRTVCPPGTQFLSLGGDYRETQVHHVVRAWTLLDGKLQGHAVDIGWTPVKRDEFGLHDATLIALRELRDKVMSGIYREPDGTQHVPGWSVIDGGYKEQFIWEFALECVALGLQTWIPVIGRGQSDPNKAGTYRQPEKIDDDGPHKKVYWLGDQCHLRKSSRHADVYAEAGCPLPPLYLLINTDEGKGFLRDGYNSPLGTNGALTYFKASDAAERDVVEDYRKQVLSEREEYFYVEGRGMVRRYTNTSRKLNHYGDADNYCCFAAQLCGAPVSLVRKAPIITPSSEPDSHLTMPDGRPFMAVEP